MDACEVKVGVHVRSVNWADYARRRDTDTPSEGASAPSEEEGSCTCTYL